MRLTYLEVSQLPGIDEPLRLARLLPGVNVIVGPNASGKSSLVRALLALLYPREHEGVIGVEARFLTGDGSSRVARRLGQDVGWERDGRPTAAPNLPAFHLVGTYTIRLEDLVGGDKSASPTRRGPGRPPALAGGGLGTDLDRLIADSILKQLTGGIDLAAVRGSVGKQSEAGKKLSGAVTTARKELSALKQRRAALNVREAELPAQYQALAAARESASRRQLVADAAQLLAARSEAGRLEDELRSFPPDLDKLRGNEDEALATLASAARVEADNVAAQELELVATQAALAASAQHAELTSGAIRLQLELADRLVDDAAKLEQRVTERRELRAQLGEAARRAGAAAYGWGGPGGGDVQRGVGAAGARVATGDLVVTDATIERVEELLQRRQSARAEADALSRRQSQLPQPEPVAEGASEDQLVRLRANLLRWSSVAPVEPRRPAWAWAGTLALTTAVVAAGSVGAPPTVVLALVGATLAWLLLVVLAVRPLASAVRRQVETETRRAQTQHGVAGPLQWAQAEVLDRIVAIDDELAARRLHAEREKQLSETARALAADLAAVRAREQEAQAELEAVRTTNGFAAGPEVLLAPWLHAVRDLDRLRTASAGVEVAGAQLAERVERARNALQAVLAAAERAGHDAQPKADLPAEELRAAVRALARAVEQREADQRRLASLTTERDRAMAELARLAHERARLLQAVGLDEQPGVEEELRTRLATLAAWRDVSQRYRASRARSEALQLRLAGDEALMAMVAAGDHAAIDAAAVSCSVAQARADELARLITQTEREIELAASDSSISQATARLEAATEALSAHRDEALRLGSARYLIDAVEAEHRSEARPPALARAAELFERFTRGQYSLRFEGDGGGKRRLAAADRAGRLVQLNELSTGTRAQLLIASRLAFALEAEGAAVEGGADRGASAPRAVVGDAHGDKEPALALPFFLDEALTTSDPERFAAVAGAILDVAALEGRQFFYLSARADDAESWRRAAAAHGSEVTVVQLGSHGAGSAALPAAN